MSMIEQLRAELDETERLARRAAWDHPTWRYDRQSFTVASATDAGWSIAAKKVDGSPINDVDGEHIVRHDPERVLRMVTAHRKILDLHAPYEQRLVGGKSAVQCEHCAELCHSRSGLACDDPVDALYPCETVKLVAEAYGITDDGDALST